MRVLLLCAVVLLFPVAAFASGPADAEPEVDLHEVFRSFWGDAWDPDAVGTVGNGDHARPMTMAEAMEDFVATGEARGWQRFFSQEDGEGGPEPPNVAFGTFQLMELWGGLWIWPQPTNCNQDGWGWGGHYEYAHYHWSPFLYEHGIQAYYGYGNSTLTQTPGPGIHWAQFLDLGSTSPTFDYDDVRVDYGPNSDFACWRYSFFGYDVVINNPWVNGYAVFS